MSHLSIQEDLHLRKRAKKNDWYKDGGHNTKFFNALATTRKKVKKTLFFRK